MIPPSEAVTTRGLDPTTEQPAGRPYSSIGFFTQYKALYTHMLAQTVFPEVDPDKVKSTQGMNIAMITTAETDEEARRLLALLGMPFRA